MHYKTEYVEFMKSKQIIDDNHKTSQKKPARLTPKNKRQATTSAQGALAKKPKKDSEAFSQRTIRSMLDKEPVLNLCGAMVVENGCPFSTFDSTAMKVMMSWGMQGIGDDSSKLPNSIKVREKVQAEAEKLRGTLKKTLKGHVLSLSTDMASKDGRCFLGKRLICAQPNKLSETIICVYF